MKVIAITNPARHGWKVMVELSRNEIAMLCRTQFNEHERTYSGSPPDVGDEFDLGPTMVRLEALEALELRENEVLQFNTLLTNIVNRHATAEAKKKKGAQA